MKKNIKLVVFLTILFISCDKETYVEGILPTPTATAVKDNLFLGTKATSGVVLFGNNYSVEYTSISLNINLNKQTKRIVSSSVVLLMNEKKQVNSNPVIGYPANTHVYSLVSQSFDGVNVNIWFIQDANSFPRNTATFTGTISGTNLSGTLQLSRTDGVTCLVRIPINALQTN